MISDNTHIASDFPAWSAQKRSVLLFLLTQRMLAPLNRNETSFLEERTTRGAEAHARQREVVQTEAVQKPAHKLQQLLHICAAYEKEHCRLLGKMYSLPCYVLKQLERK